MSRSFVGCVLFLAAVVLAQTTEGAENSCILTPDVGSREPARPAESDKPLARFYSDATPTLCAGHKGANAARKLEIHVLVQDDSCYSYYDVDVVVDQADAEGHESENCSAVMMTDSHDGDNGMFKFLTVLPGPYKDARFSSGMRPSVIGFHILKQDPCHCFEAVRTQVYFKDDPHLSKDPCTTCGAGEQPLFFDCMPFSSDAKLDEPLKCSLNLTVKRNVSCDDNPAPQPEIQCRPECANGGTCAASGVCVCPAGFTGFLCDKHTVPDPKKCTYTEPTPCAEMGPFWRPSQPRRSPMCVTDPNYNSSTVMKMKFTLAVQEDHNCNPMANVPIDLWHANSLGQYMDNDCRSAEVTDENGMLTVETVYPMNYTGRPHHIHIFVHNTSMCHDRLVIQGYFKGDPLRSPQREECRACHSDDPRLTMACSTEGQLMTCNFVAILKRFTERPGCGVDSQFRISEDEMHHHFSKHEPKGNRL